MATAAQEASRIRQMLEAEDRALERDTRAAAASVRRACAQMMREERAAGRGGGTGRLLHNSWRRPPTKHMASGLNRLFGVRAERPSRIGKDGKRYVTFHFIVGQSSSQAGARKHQAYIERPGECVVSFGNIADTMEERIRLWDAIGEKAVFRKGRIVIGADAPEALKEAAIERAVEWGEAKRIGPRIAASVRTHGKAYWAKKEFKLWTFDEDDHERLGEWVRQWSEDGRGERSEHEEVEEVEQGAGQPGLFDEAAQAPREGQAEDEREREEEGEREEEVVPEAGAKEGADEERGEAVGEPEKRRGLPPGVREFTPRGTVIQRRIVMELAHELPLEEQERYLRAWCESELGSKGAAYHAAIHQPEGANDNRNWHAHVVRSPYPVEKAVRSASEAMS